MRTTSIFALATTLLVSVAVLSGCGVGAPTPTEQPDKAPTELTVSAAATLRQAFEQLAPEFEKANNATIVFNFGASGALQKQIEGGASVDVFASASPAQVDALVAGGLVSQEATSSFISNELVIVVPSGNPAGVAGPADLMRAKRLATGDPESAPHGTKAKEWLEGQGLWDDLEGTFVFGENAAQTTDYVARGEVDAAILFASEAVGRADMEVAYSVPNDQIKPIRYVIAPLDGSAEPDVAQAFVDFVMSAPGQQALLDNGFVAYESQE